MHLADVSAAAALLGALLGGVRYVSDQRQHREDRETANRLLTEIRDDARRSNALG